MYVVTGGAGFIGSNLLAMLEERGVGQLVCVDNCTDPSKARNIAKRSKKMYRIMSEDLFNFLEKWGHEVQGIFHLGALSSTVERDMKALLAVNVTLTRRLWMWCSQRELPFIYASSAATYGAGEHGFEDQQATRELIKLKPLNPYAISKHTFDMWVAARMEDYEYAPPTRWAGLKFFNVYGPNELHKGTQASLVTQIYAKAAVGAAYDLFKSHNPRYAHGEQRRDFIYVDDCCKIMMWWMFEGTQSGLFNVGTGTARTFLELATAVYASAGRIARINFKDMPEELREQYQYETVAPIRRLRESGYTQPMTELEDGIEKTVEKYLAYSDPYR